MTSSPTHSDSLSAEKAALRRTLEARRKRAHEDLEKNAGAEILSHFRKTASVADDAVIAGYWPFRSEIDPRPLMQALHERGHEIVLPVVTEKDTPLTFRRWEPGATLLKAGLGGLAPPEGQPERDPDLLLVPMLAFDAAGYRLGYGGGFYDRTLERLRAMRTVEAIGVAYEAQRVGAVPREATDQRLDAILTERGLFPFKGNGL